MRATFSESHGFTLVELMVVVLIIGVLVAIAIPTLNTARGTAATRTCQSNQRTIEGSVEQYLSADPVYTRGTCGGTGWIAVLVGPSRYIGLEPDCPVDDSKVDTDYDYDASTALVSCVSVAAHPHY